MKRRSLRSAISLLLIVLVSMQLVGCAGMEEPSTVQPEPTQTGVQAPTLKTVNLMAEIAPQAASSATVTAEAAAAASDFALRLFRAGATSTENTLLSPISVLCALAMTANGAQGETRTQMEDVLGKDCALWNSFFRAYQDALSDDEVLQLANSIWFTASERFTVNRDFLQTNADFYGSDVYQAPFDETTLADINGWVKEKTKGMIPEILDEIPESAVMYLINALAFDANWETPYSAYSIASGDFYCQDGTSCQAVYMSSTEEQYLETDKLTGFLKPYKGGKYAFVALLPKEGLTTADVLESLDGASLQAMLSAPQQISVDIALPKFEGTYSAELSEVLTAMGMELPFDHARADFSGLGVSEAGNIFISRVLHKTFISVNENGTQAAAATVVEACDEACVVDYKSVFLDRPFVYLLIDCETNLPLFLGTMLNPTA